MKEASIDWKRTDAEDQIRRAAKGKHSANLVWSIRAVQFLLETLDSDRDFCVRTIHDALEENRALTARIVKLQEEREDLAELLKESLQLMSRDERMPQELRDLLGVEFGEPNPEPAVNDDGGL